MEEGPPGYDDSRDSIPAPRDGATRSSQHVACHRGFLSTWCTYSPTTASAITCTAAARPFTYIMLTNTYRRPLSTHETADWCTYPDANAREGSVYART